MVSHVRVRGGERPHDSTDSPTTPVPFAKGRLASQIDVQSVWEYISD